MHIPNAADTESSGEVVLPDSLDRMLDAAHGKFLVMYAGALGVAQDLPTVLGAFAELRSRNPAGFERFAAILVGGGVSRESASETARELGLDNVHVHEPIEKRAVPQLLAKADACLLPLAEAGVFKYGLSPNKLFDYFAAGKPVLIAANDPTVVDEAGAGLRYRPGDPGALADAIVQLMATSPEERAAMGARGRELVRTRYSVSAVADQYEALLDEVLARHRHT
jgi:glycosyltransferase involved in cell wall biosynthesis